MNYILDIAACGGITFLQLFKVILIGILVQGLVYRVTGFSIYNFMKKSIEKEIYSDQTMISLKK
ncbi:MAG: hypothetical protein J6K45_06375 [Clostridia bacterium]|nr:hypothetical protein [Clostridia bacterium]